MWSCAIRVMSLVVGATVAAPAAAQWVANGRDAMYSMYLPQAKKPDTHALFLVAYEKRWSCRPAVSVILMTGRKLGVAQRQTTEKNPNDQLSIAIDGRTFTAETKITMYSNAMELAMFAPVGLIDALARSPKSVVARLGAGLGGFDFSDAQGFSAANDAARKACY